MVAFSAFYPYIAPWVRNVSEPLMDQMIRQTARDMAVRTNCEVITQRVDSVANQPDYTLLPGTDREAWRLLKVFFKTRELALDANLDVSDPLALVGNIDVATAVAGMPSDAYGNNPLTKVTLYPLPEEAITNGLTVRFSVRPTLTSADVPDVLLRYEHVVAAGAVARLQSMTGQPWSDPVSAGGSRIAYELGVASMRADIMRGNAQSARRVRPVRFA